MFIYFEKDTGGLVLFDLDAMKDLGLRYRS
jgi:hypothetical protein